MKINYETHFYHFTTNNIHFSTYACQEQAVEKISYQEYYRSMNQLRDDIKSGNFEQTIPIFDRLIKQIDHVPSDDLLRMALKSAELEKCDLAGKYLTRAIENGIEYGKGVLYLL